MDRPTLQEQLDACRTAADAAGDENLRDLQAALTAGPSASPSLDAANQGSSDQGSADQGAANQGAANPVAEQLAAQLRMDGAIGRKLNEVAIPEGLKAQLAAAFRQGSMRHEEDKARFDSMTARAIGGKSESADSESASRKLELSEAATPVKARLLVKRRDLGKWAAGAAALSMLAIVYAVWSRPKTELSPALSEATFAKAALQFSREDSAGRSAGWKSFGATEKSPLDWNGAKSTLVSKAVPQRWRTLKTKYVGQWQLWELSTGREARVLVLAAEMPPEMASGMAAALSRTPTHSSDGWSVGVWRRNGVAYALVVEGDSAAYRAWVRTQEIGALAPANWNENPAF